jgi:eukaryotic-like serine/threonine-protein kinase
MDPNRYARLQDLFHAVADLTPADRAAYLAQHCAPGETLDELEALLGEDARSQPALDQGLAPHLELSEGFIPRQLGPYRLERLLGEGGMGVVYLGFREDLSSYAAIKILRDAWLSPARRERFQFEQRTLAQLNHPSIAKLYDAGTLTEGTPWFAMEYVEGRPITDRSGQDSLNLFLQVCQAVQYAHQHAVIHRDLKPSNILVTEDGKVKLLDFGIAKHLDNTGDQTVTGLRLMTPAYAAPEQLRGEPVGVYTDVYSLGLILRELLPGKLSPDLDILIQTALQQEPQRRYHSVDALIRDIHHYLAGEPIEARPDTFTYRASKFIQRNLTSVVASSIALVSLVGLVTFYTINLREARNQALAEAVRSSRIRSFLVNLFEGGDMAAGPASDLRVATLLDRGVVGANALKQDPQAQAEVLRTLGDVYQKLGRLDQSDTLLVSALDRKRDVDNLNSLALLRTDQAKHEEAEKLARESLALARGTEQNVAKAATTLGHVLEEKGDYDKAIPILEEAIRILSGPGQPPMDLAAALLYLGNVHFYKGRYEQSQDLNQRALAIYRQTQGPDHPIVAEVLINLGAIQQDTGHYKEAEAFHRQALGIIESYYGGDHPKTASTLTLIGRALVLQTRLAEASGLLTRALSIRERVYGPDHTQVASTVNELGTNALSRGAVLEAEAHFERMISIYEKAYNGRHYLIGIAKSNLGSVYMRREQWSRAEPLFRQSLELYAHTLPPGHINEGIGRIKLGRILLRQKKYEEARMEIQRGQAIVAKQASPSVSWLNNAKKDLAEIAALPNVRPIK